MEPKNARRLFTHAKRPEWGVGLLLDESADPWTLAFEDGSRRTLGKAHPLLEPKELAPSDRDALLKRLTPKKAAPARKATRASAHGARRTSATFAQQVAAFRRKFPDGFADPKYLRDVETKEPGEHRQNDGAVDDAKTTLSHDTLAPLMKPGGYEAVHRSAVRLMSSQRNLVVRFDLSRFSAMSSASHARFALALDEVLHGKGPEEARWDAYARSLKSERPATWPLLTLLPALHRPSEMVYVRSSLYRRQASVLDQPVPADALPSGRGYIQFRDVARQVRDSLTAAGHEPRDMWDVYRFVWLTMSPRSDASLA